MDFGDKMHKTSDSAALGNVTDTLGGGKDYTGAIPATGNNGGMTTSLSNIQTSGINSLRTRMKLLLII